MSQVVLQWAWGIFLFVSPSYAQPECSGTTQLVLFMFPSVTNSINDLDRSGARFLIWPAWILFSLCISLFFTAYLAKVGSIYSKEDPSSAATALSSTTPVLKQWGSMILNALPSGVRDEDFGDIFVKGLAVGLWAMYISGKLFLCIACEEALLTDTVYFPF